MIRALAISIAVVRLAACSARRKAPTPASPPAEASGFLDDYAALRPGGPDDVALGYRNPNADWPASDGPLPPEVAKFVANAAIEGEVQDAQTKVLLAQGVDRQPPGVAPATTWGELDQRFARRADRVCGGLAARTGRGS